MQKIYDVSSLMTKDGCKLLYRGFVGTVEVDLDENMLHGKVIALVNRAEGSLHFTEFTNLCIYEGHSVKQLKKDFKNAIDNYLNEIEI